jgi:iron transport multicopper oxidase
MMLLNSPDMYAGLSRGHFVSSDGPCKTFDDEANGYCRGEAVASVVLKRLDAATADNDNILGVIEASATNYSAYAASITQPHAGTQERLFRKVLSQAGAQPEHVDYVELHGTGTQLGDSVEMASILNVLAPGPHSGARKSPLYVGSIKANIGHGESASGISALIKSLLLFQKQQIPPHIGIKSGRINRTFPPLEQRGVMIADKLIPFPKVSGRKRRILINNFGAAGGNSSFLLAEGGSNSYSPILTSPQHSHVVSVTAKTESSLQGNLVNLADYLDKYPNTVIEDLAYTTTARRVQYPLRVSIVASTIAQAKQAIRARSQLQDVKTSTKSHNLVFVFTGQGSLSSNIGKKLFESNHTFRSHLITLERIAIDHGFPTFVQEIITGKAEFDKLTPVQTQLCHVAIQLALVELWLSWNIKPSSVVGHSLGEYAALFAAGALSASDTLYLVGRRATLLQKLCTSSTHKMLAVKLPVSEVQRILIDRVHNYEISCLNGPSDVVISGPTATVQQAERLLKTDGIPCTILNVPYAFHSSQIDPIMAAFGKEALSIPISGLRVPLLSTLLGTTVQVGCEIDRSYFTRHAREPVQLMKAISSAREDGMITAESTFLELGPHPVCLNMIRPTLDSSNRCISSLYRSEDCITTISRSLAELNEQGFSIDWTEYYNGFGSPPRLLALPSYAFDEKNYWIPYRNDWLLQRHGNHMPLSSESTSSNMTTTVQRVISSVVDGSNATVIFESDLSDPSLHKLIAGHVLNGIALCPSVSQFSSRY